MKNKLLLISLIIFSLLLIPKNVLAHVLISDDSKRIGAILHVNPDDDPIAGQQTNFFFDIQSQALDNGNYTAKFVITSSAGQPADVPLTLSGASASANYIFPVQGIYELRLTTTSPSNSYTFSYSQRVSRGTSGSALDRPEYAWAEMALVACASLFLILLVVAFNRRKEIVGHSKI